MRLYVAIGLAAMGLSVLGCKHEKVPEPKVTVTETGTLGEPGGSIEEKVVVEAKVTEVNKDKRQVTVVGPEGRKTTFVLGPEAQNFDQIATGDLVKATVVREITATAEKPGSVTPDAAALVAARTPQGSKPGVFVGGDVQVVGKVTSIDAATRKAVVEFADGSQVCFVARPDIDLSKYPVGELLVFNVAEAITVDVVKDEKAK